MRTLPANVTAAIAGPVISPAYLVEIAFSTTIRACTKDSVEWNGLTWPQAGMNVGEVTTGAGGLKTVAVSMANNAFAISQIVLAETASGKLVKVWKLFGDGPYAYADAQLLFDGYIDEVPEMGNRVVFNCSTGPARTISIPHVTIGPPFFNFVPKPGQLIQWGGETFELQPR